MVSTCRRESVTAAARGRRSAAVGNDRLRGGGNDLSFGGGGGGETGGSLGPRHRQRFVCDRYSGSSEETTVVVARAVLRDILCSATVACDTVFSRVCI